MDVRFIVLACFAVLFQAGRTDANLVESNQDSSSPKRFFLLGSSDSRWVAGSIGDGSPGESHSGTYAEESFARDCHDFSKVEPFSSLFRHALKPEQIAGSFGSVGTTAFVDLGACDFSTVPAPFFDKHDRSVLAVDANLYDILLDTSFVRVNRFRHDGSDLDESSSTQSSPDDSGGRTAALKIPDQLAMCSGVLGGLVVVVSVLRRDRRATAFSLNDRTSNATRTGPPPGSNRDRHGDPSKRRKRRGSHGSRAQGRVDERSSNTG